MKQTVEYSWLCKFVELRPLNFFFFFFFFSLSLQSDSVYIYIDLEIGRVLIYNGFFFFLNQLKSNFKGLKILGGRYAYIYNDSFYVYPYKNRMPKHTPLLRYVVKFFETLHAKPVLSPNMLTRG